MAHDFAGPYTDEHLERILYPLGGIGTGSMCLTGAGGLTAVALRHHPAVFHSPLQFASIHLEGVEHGARVLEGPVMPWEPLFPWGRGFQSAGGGCRGSAFGFPRFAEASFRDRFPAAEVTLRDPDLPVEVTLTAWSPFVPGDADSSSTPAIVLEYRIRNLADRPLDAVVGFHSRNHLACRPQAEGAGVGERDDGFVFTQQAVEHAHEAGSFRVASDGEDRAVDTGWFRGGWFDAQSLLWQRIAAGTHESRRHDDGPASPGGSLTNRVELPALGEATVRFRLCWHVPTSDLSAGRNDLEDCGEGCDCGPGPTHRPRYAALHADVDAVDAYLVRGFDDLRARSMRFGELLAAGDLPGPLREAAVANLGILRSPTVLRQADGRLWLWEGCNDSQGCCPGSCTHVWNWAQPVAHFFPELERGLRESEFREGQDERGSQRFRVSLPIQQIARNPWWTAVDGQLGGIIKLWREWRIAGDEAWLRALWPRVQAGLEWIIQTWDPQRSGVLRGPQHNTYDVEFHGPNGMMMSCYLAALVAAADMARALGEDGSGYTALADRCRAFLENELWDGRTFIQLTEEDAELGEHLNPIAPDGVSPEQVALQEAEGPRYQYGRGVLITALLGEWLAEVGGLETGLDRSKVATYLESVLEHNLRRDLRLHANPQRCSYAFGDEGGTVLCAWPEGDAPSLPFPYSEEVWTSLEYQTASHLLRFGRVDRALEVVAIARARYDGTRRSPFDEMECGHWYGRALASWDLVTAWGGARYDAVTRTMHLRPAGGGDCAVPFVRGDCWGLAGVRDGEPFYEPWAGELPIERWEVSPVGDAVV